MKREAADRFDDVTGAVVGAVTAIVHDDTPTSYRFITECADGQAFAYLLTAVASAYVRQLGKTLGMTDDQATALLAEVTISAVNEARKAAS